MRKVNGDRTGRHWFKKYVSNNEGFTLIELIAVITILGIIAAISVPNVHGMIVNSKDGVCDVNTTYFERSYENHLLLEGMEHSDAILTQYLNESETDVCPVDGEIYYEDEEVKCSLHSHEDHTEHNEEEDSGVPIL